MPIEFNGSPSTTLGVELELGLVDRETRQLVPVAIEVLDDLAVWFGIGPARVRALLNQLADDAT